MTEVKGQKSMSAMQRDKFISRKIFCFALSVLLLALCVSAEAQQPKKVPRIGFIALVPPTVGSANRDAFQQGLHELGYVEGENIVIERRYTEGKFDRVPDLVADLVRLKVDIIVTTSSASARLP